MPAIPVLLAWLGEVVVSEVGAWALSALVTLGIGFAANKAATGIIDSSQIMSAFRASSALWAWVTYTKLDVDVTIVLSAWAGRGITDSVKAHLARLPKKAS